MKLKRKIVGLIIIISISGCAREVLPERHYALEDVSTEYLTLDMKIGQMIIIGFNGTGTNEESIQFLGNLIEDGLISGLLYYGGNISGPDQAYELNTYFQNQSTLLPLFLTVDQEGGFIQRLSKSKGFKDFPSPRSIGERYSMDRTDRVYNRMAKIIHNAGFNVNFAPVVDIVKTDEGGMHTAYMRSFSSDAYTVAEYASTMIKAHHQWNVLTALKHFPGLGSTTNDTHYISADVTDTWGQDELIPYRYAMYYDLVDMVMIAHIINTNIDPDYTASLSPAHIITNLRLGLEYDGVVITDDLLMGAVKNNYSLEESIIQAVLAGNDILLFSTTFYNEELIPALVVETIKQAVDDGIITEERINQSYRRILELKTRLIDQSF